MLESCLTERGERTLDRGDLALDLPEDRTLGGLMGLMGTTFLWGLGSLFSILGDGTEDRGERAFVGNGLSEESSSKARFPICSRGECTIVEREGRVLCDIPDDFLLASLESILFKIMVSLFRFFLFNGKRGYKIYFLTERTLRKACLSGDLNLFVLYASLHPRY